MLQIMITVMKINYIIIISLLLFCIACKDKGSQLKNLDSNLKGNWSYLIENDREYEINSLESDLYFNNNEFVVNDGLFNKAERKFLGSKFQFTVKSDSLFIKSNTLNNFYLGLIILRNDTLYLNNEGRSFKYVKEKPIIEEVYKMDFVQLLYYNIDNNLFYLINNHKEIIVLSYNENSNFYSYYNANINDEYYNFLISRLATSKYFKKNNKILSVNEHNNIFYYQASNLYSNKEDLIINNYFSDIVSNINNKNRSEIINFYEPNSHLIVNNVDVDKAYSLYILSSILKYKVNYVDFVNSYNLRIGFYPSTLNAIKNSSNSYEQSIIDFSLNVFNRKQNIKSVTSDGKNFCIDIKNQEKIYATIPFDILKMILDNKKIISIK